MARSSRPLTHRPQRKLTDKQVKLLLTAYVHTDTTYAALSEQYGLGENAISRIVRNLSYLDVPGVADLRNRAQAKAAARYRKYSCAEILRGPDPSKVKIEVDPHSIESIDAAIVHLKAIRRELARRSRRLVAA